MRRPQNLKKSPTCFDKTAIFTQYRQNKWQIFFKFLWPSQYMQTLGNFQALQNKCNCLYFKVISPSVHLGCLPSKLAWSSAQFAQRAHSLQLQCGQKLYEIAKSMHRTNVLVLNTPVWFFNMAIRVVEFSNGVYKIRKIFA